MRHRRVSYDPGFYSGEQVYVVCNSTFNTMDYKKASRDGVDPMQMLAQRCVDVINRFAPAGTMTVDAYPDVVFLDVNDGEEWWWELYFAVEVYVDDPDKFEDRLIEPEGTIDASLQSEYSASMRWGYFTQRPAESTFQPDWAYWESSPYLDF